MFLDIIQPIPLVILHLTILLATHFTHYHSQQESVYTLLTNACHQDSRCLVNLIYIINLYHPNFHVWYIDLYAGSPGAAGYSPIPFRPQVVHSQQPFRPSSAQFPMMGIIIIIIAMCIHVLSICIVYTCRMCMHIIIEN